MKLKSSKAASTFAPITLTFTLETESEAQAFYMAFNHTSVTDVIDRYGINTQLIRKELESLGVPYNNALWEEIHESIKQFSA